jgi:hypothetical protein
MTQVMDSTVVIYEPPWMTWYTVGMTFAVLTFLSTLCSRNQVEVDEDIWRYCGMIIDLRGVPGELGKAALEAGVVYTSLYEREYPSGKFAWRVKINDKFYYLSRTLVRLKAVPA